MTSEPTNNASLPPPAPARRFNVAPGLLTTGVIVLTLAVGAAAGAGASRVMHKWRPEAVLLLQPAPIAQLKDQTPVAVKGQVAEVYGNKFIVQDDSGRTLVDTGPRGESAKPVAKGEAVTVQGRFDNGFIHAQVMTRADGTTEAFGPSHPPRPPHGPDDRPGPRADRGLDRGAGPGPDRAIGDQPPPPR